MFREADSQLIHGESFQPLLSGTPSSVLRSLIVCARCAFAVSISGYSEQDVTIMLKMRLLTVLNVSHYT